MSSVKRELIERYGKIYTTGQATKTVDFKNPFAGVSHIFIISGSVEATRKSDGKKGSLRFIHQPRYYFDFKEV